MTIDKAISEIIGTNYGEVQCHQETMVLAVAALREKAGCEKGAVKMAKQTIDEVMEDYKDCQRCEGKSCLGMVSNCSKPDSIVQVESELLRKLIADISLDRLEEICTAEKDGRCMVLPCKVGTPVYKIFCNKVYPALVDKIIINRFTNPPIWIETKLEFSTSVIDRYDLVIGKTVFLTREEAEAALKET